MQSATLEAVQRGETRAGFPRKLLEVLALLLTFVLTLVGGADHADAAPIGMCSETAQSIEAPPPMFPSATTTIEAQEEASSLGCLSDDENRFGVNQGGSPNERVSASSQLPDQKVVLGNLVPVLRTQSVSCEFLAKRLSLPDEHRWRGLRPPRS